MSKDLHFCEDPTAAVCDYPLAVGGDFSRFYNETTPNFADVSCEECRDWLRANKLRPEGGNIGFPDPPEWSR